ncbi:hypothetical protein ABL78_2525 [Leptomonas seymouri]|uniref:Uncharacterized protein n=1 Tax=Leptomonas seymouri TaxID=5684 RepID=A0A0N1PE95_LEPSE|nr:hypothetical protein ABL78_2525 [Leptomonas seymouri]|eukprot:KPI88351.1 hypothetical protein ABL78_2525 [Leptomonas seymouri]
MSASHDSAGQPATNSVASNGNSSNGSMRTPVAATGTTVFLRVEDGANFMPVHHQSSITLRDLAEEFNVSSVLECDARGNVQPRTVAFDSPSDVLHSGRHYIARRDVKAEAGNSSVTFKGKIVVKEYELEHPTPPTNRPGHTVSIAEMRRNQGAPDEVSRWKPATTPFVGKRHRQEALDMNEEGPVAHTEEGGTPRLQRMTDNEEEATISRALALSFERKRQREDSVSKMEAHTQASSCRDANGLENAVAGYRGAERMDGVLNFQSSTPKSGRALLDRTNFFISSPINASKTLAVPPVSELHADEVTGLLSSDAPAPLDTSTAVPQPQKQSLRFIPFTEIAADGTEMYVTLDSLQQLCNELSTHEAEFQRKHREATDILEGARRVLFLHDGNE